MDFKITAASIELPSEDVAYLEEFYKPVENLISIGTS